MDPLDGNAIAGALFESFGREMTAVIGACGHCGAQARVAELRVYAKAPGAVARCPGCSGVVIVVVEISGQTVAHQKDFHFVGDRAGG